MKKNFFNLLKQQNSTFYKVEKSKQVLMKALKLTKKVNLFLLGSENKWQKTLPKEILSKAEKEFRDDLNFFNY